MPDACPKTNTFVLGLGSNLGDRMAQLRSAVLRLESNDIHVLARSRVYQTPPVGPPQPDYFNAAVRVSSPVPPADLLTVSLHIERALGRTRPDPVRWGPRTIDIDVLWYAGGRIDAPGLEVPHPRLNERSFALLPLLDVAPDARDPESGRRYAELPASHEPLRVVGQL
jgi:2-amino-4-hydroxy-6-hydroxymethyldihydropteridine diphosphokinase